MNFKDILHKFRTESFTEKEKGTKFERLMRSWLLTDPRYNEEGVSELDEQFERLPDGHEAKRSYYLGFRQAQSEARPNIVISLLKLN